MNMEIKMKYLAMFLFILSVASVSFAPLYKDIQIQHVDDCSACSAVSKYPDSSMFVADNPGSFKADVIFFYDDPSKNPSHQPIQNAPIIVAIRDAQDPSKIDLRKILTDKDGKATFDYSSFAKNTKSCKDMDFFYCPFKSGCGFDACLKSMGLEGKYKDMTSIPNADGVNFNMPADFPMPKFLPPAPQSINYCPPPKIEIPAFCFPLAMIFALLAGALHLSGRNPLTGFDMSAPRKSHFVRYAARSRSMLNVDVVSWAASIANATTDAKGKIKKAIAKTKGGAGKLPEGKAGAKTAEGTKARLPPAVSAKAPAHEAHKPQAVPSQAREQAPTRWEIAKNVITSILGATSLGFVYGSFSGFYSEIIKPGIVDPIRIKIAEKKIEAYKAGKEITLKDGTIVIAQIKDNAKMTFTIKGKNGELIELKEGTLQFRETRNAVERELTGARTGSVNVYAALAQDNAERAANLAGKFIQLSIDSGDLTISGLEARKETLGSSLKEMQQKLKVATEDGDNAGIAKYQSEIDSLQKQIGNCDNAETYLKIGGGVGQTVGGKGGTQAVRAELESGDETARVVNARMAVLEDILAEKAKNAFFAPLQQQIDALSKDPEKNKVQIESLKAQVDSQREQLDIMSRMLRPEAFLEKGVAELAKEKPEAALIYQQYSSAKAASEYYKDAGTAMEVNLAMQEKVKSTMESDPNVRMLASRLDMKPSDLYTMAASVDFDQEKFKEIIKPELSEKFGVDVTNAGPQTIASLKAEISSRKESMAKAEPGEKDEYLKRIDQASDKVLSQKMEQYNVLSEAASASATLTGFENSSTAIFKQVMAGAIDVGRSNAATPNYDNPDVRHTMETTSQNPDVKKVMEAQKEQESKSGTYGPQTPDKALFDNLSKMAYENGGDKDDLARKIARVYYDMDLKGSPKSELENYKKYADEAEAYLKNAKTPQERQRLEINRDATMDPYIKLSTSIKCAEALEDYAKAAYADKYVSASQDVNNELKDRTNKIKVTSNFISSKYGERIGVD